MSLIAIKFDPISYVKKLRDAGLPQEQAEIQAQELENIIEQQVNITYEQTQIIQEQKAELINLKSKNLATKGDLTQVKLELQKEIEIVRKEISQLKHDTLKFTIWTGISIGFVTITTIIGAMYTMLKLIPLSHG